MVKEKAAARKIYLIGETSRVRRAILSAAAAVPPHKAVEIFLGSWSLLDLLAHLAGWDNTNRAAAQALKAGQLPAFSQQRDRDWQSYNALLVSQYRRDSLDEQLALVENNHAGLLAYLEALPAQVFDQDFGVRYRGYRVTIARLIESESHDEAVHLEQIINWLGRPAKTPAPAQSG
jgi:hypothetical protein